MYFMQGENEQARQASPLDAKVRAAKGGDLVAADELFQHFGPALRGYLQRRIGGGVARFLDIDDLRQEVCTSMVPELGRLRDGATQEDFRRLLFLHAGWAVGMARRKASVFDGESKHGPGQVPPVPAGMGSVTKRDLMGWVRDRIDLLGQEVSAVVLGVLTGKSFQEISDELGIPISTARRRYLHATERLSQAESEEK